MPALQIARGLLLLAEIVLALPILYLCILSASALLYARKRAEQKSALTRSEINFAILIPAHNEETIIGTLLQSLSELVYPKDLYTVYVIADNCTDSTAELVRNSGWARVYERHDLSRRGKGFALNWMLQRLDEEQLMHDAYIVLDADSVVAPNFLQAMAHALGQGAQALQAHNTVLNTSASPSTALRWIALTLMNHVRPLGRNGLGASSTLTGNGMCLRRALLQRHPWQAFSTGEDYQYYLTLIGHGEHVLYVPEAVVRSEMPTTFAQMRTQDIRWEANVGAPPTWRVALRLLRSGLSNRDLARIEAVVELLTPPLSFLVGWCFLVLLASLLVGTSPELLAGLVLSAGLLCYIGTALYLLRPPRAIYVALLHAPRFVLWKLWVYFVLRKSKKHTGEWVRTSRTGA